MRHLFYFCLDGTRLIQWNAISWLGEGPVFRGYFHSAFINYITKYSTAVNEVEQESKYAVIKDIPYLTLTGELWVVCCKDLGVQKHQTVLYLPQLTRWGRVTHICVGKLTIIGSDNGLSPGRRQAIIWTNAGILLIGPWGTNFSEILIGIQAFSFKKMHLKMSSAKWPPFRLGLNVLNQELTELQTQCQPEEGPKADQTQWVNICYYMHRHYVLENTLISLYKNFLIWHH